MPLKSSIGLAVRQILSKFRTPNPAVVIPLGKHSYGQPEVVGVMPFVKYLSAGSSIGNFCSLSSGLKFVFYSKHSVNWVSTYPFAAFYDSWKMNNEFYNKGIIDVSKIKPNPIIIENDVWIATNVTVKEGVRIGNGAVVAMNSLVTKDVPPYAIVGGNPARVIRYRFTEKQIASLLKIAWWNWEDDKIKKVLPLLNSANIDGFIETALNAT